MANNQLKFDISSTVRQVEELNRSLQGLGQIAQTLFANLGQLSGAFGNKISDLSQNVGSVTATPGQMLTPAGQQNAEAALNDEIKRARIRREIEENTGKFIVAPGGQIQERTTVGGQTRLAFTGLTKESLYRNVGAEQAFNNATAVNNNIPAQASRPIGPTYGYGIQDIPRVVAAQKDVAGLGTTLNKAISDVAESNKGIAEILKAIKGSLEETNNDFTAALNDFSQKSHLEKSSPEYQASASRMVSAAAAFEKAKDNAEEMRRMYGGGGGGGGADGDGEDPRRRKLLGLQNLASRGAALVGTGVALYGAYESTSLAFEKAVYGKELEYKESRGQATSRIYQQALEANDMTKAENILKYRADLLLPGRKFDALGAEGGANTMRMATDMIKDMRDIQRRERNLSLVGAGGQLVQGGLQIGAGVALGAALGTALLPGLGTAAGATFGGLFGAGIAGDALSRGIGTVGGVIRDTPQAMINNPYTAYSGGLTGGLGGMAGRFMLGGRYGSLAQYAQLAERQKDVTTALDILERGRQAELQQNAPTLMALNESLQSMEAMRESAFSVGRYATGPNYYRKMRQNLGDVEAKIEETKIIRENSKALAIRALGGDRIVSQAEAELQKYALNKAAAEKGMEGLLRGASERLGTPLIDRLAKETEVGLTEDLSKLQKLPWQRFGMSEAEFIRAQGMASSVISRGVGIGASDAQTSRLLDLKYGGFGSMEQLTGNLIGLNKAAGGQDNLQRLERIMTVAVAEGFDRSRMTQAFVNSTNELSRTLNVTTPENMARTLGALTGFTGVIGKPDERQLERASKGIADYAAFSGQTGGTIGALKLQAAYGAGIGIGGGANILRSMNAEETASALKELESGGPIKSERLRALINLQGGDISKVKAGLTGQLSGGSQLQLRAVYDLTASAGGRAGLGSMIEKFKGTTDKQERKTILEKIQAGAMETAATMGISEVGALAGIGTILEQELKLSDKYGSKDVKKHFEAAKDAAMRKSVDPAAVNLRKFIDSQVNTFTTQTTLDKVGAKEFFRLQKEHGISLTTASGREITKERYEEALAAKGDKKKEAQEYINEANKALESVNTLDLVRSASAKASYFSGEQSVRISNVTELSIALAVYLKKAKLNLGDQ